MLESEYDIFCRKNELIIKEKGKACSVDLREKVLEFAVNSMKFIATIPYRKEYEVFRYQYSKSATSTCLVK
ncbi:MAG: hypothetical protein P8078_09035 [bacterium]